MGENVSDRPFKPYIILVLTGQGRLQKRSIGYATVKSKVNCCRLTSIKETVVSTQAISHMYLFFLVY